LALRCPFLVVRLDFSKIWTTWYYVLMIQQVKERNDDDDTIHGSTAHKVLDHPVFSLTPHFPLAKLQLRALYYYMMAIAESEESQIKKGMASKWWWDKRMTTSEIMAIVVVKEGDGRFLQVGGCWVDVDGNVAREKVSHAFRSRRRIIAKAGA
jgi:hypothetical protein